MSPSASPPATARPRTWRPAGLDCEWVALFNARADVALYAAKRSGRDRVRVWSGEMGAGGELPQVTTLTESAQHRVLNGY